MLDFIFGIIGMILYPLFSIIFILVDILQAIFRTFAGIGGAGYGDTLWNIQNITAGNSGTETDTGLVFFLLNTPLVKNMLISIMVLGLFLLIIFTVMAFIKNAYSAKQKGWKEIVGNTIKGLANFIFLPVCCLLGVWLGNILLNAIDGATSTGDSTLMSRKLFIAAAYNANLYRNGEADDTDSKILQRVYDYAKGANIITVGDIPVTQADIDATQTNEERAELVDRIYASGAMNIYTHDGAGQGYSLYQINYLTLIIGGVFMLYVLISLAYGMIRRMFILLMLYIISPALCAMYPIDEGKAAGSWKSDFIKQTISAYGAVAGMNLFFSLLPLVNNIQLFGGNIHKGADALTGILVAVNNIIGIDTIIQLLIMVSGLFVVKEFISMITGYIGAEDAYSKGASLRGQTKKAMQDYGKKAIGGTSKALGGAFAASKAHKDESWVKRTAAFNHSLFKTGLKNGGSALGFNVGETLNDIKSSYKSGGDAYKRQQDIADLISRSKSYNAAADTTGFTAKKLRQDAEKLGILDDVDKSIIKSRGKGETLEEYRKNVELAGNLDRDQKGFNKANKQSGVLNSSLEAAQRAYDKWQSAIGTADAATKKASFDAINQRLKENHSIDFNEIAKGLSRALGSKDILSQIQAGRQVSADEMDVKKIQAEYGISRSEAVEMANSFQLLNNAVDRKKSYDDKFAEASEKLIESTKAMKDWADGSKATAASFDKTMIDGMVAAIEKATNTGSAIAYDASTILTLNNTVNQLLETEKRQADALNKMAKDNKIKAAADKAEKDKNKK